MSSETRIVYVRGHLFGSLRLLLAAGAIAVVSSASAAEFVVTTVDDRFDGVCDSDCTLREAVTAANTLRGLNTIRFASGVTGIIQLQSALPDLTSDVTIRGPGANMLTVRRDAGGNYRIFTIRSEVDVTLEGLTLANGQATGSPANGGSILNEGELTLRHCTITGNRATNGGAIFNRGGVANSFNGRIFAYAVTLSDNVATAFGGAVFSSSPEGAEANPSFLNCTFSGNSATTGAAIRNLGSTSGEARVGMQNCTFSANSGGAGVISLDGASATAYAVGTIFNTPAGASTFVLSNGATVTSGGYNVSSDAVGGSTNNNAPGGLLNQTGDRRNSDPMLDPAGLRQNGGSTPTIALQAGSPALNRLPDDISAERRTDQRGMFRNGLRDAGSFELGGTLPIRLANIATRLRVGTGDNALIGGFIITGTQPKRIIIRAVGPSTFLEGALPDPKLQFYDGSGSLLAENDNWQQSPDRDAIIASGVAPLTPSEPAVIRTVAPGAYTAVVTGVNDSTGIGLVEVYDLDRTVDSRLANISTRGLVQTGDDVMIGGVIVDGDSSSLQRVIIRAIGPSLNLPGALADPTLTLYNSQGTILNANDDWRSGQMQEVVNTGIPPADDRESAIVQILSPGAYTAIVRGRNDTTGLALVEVYDLQ